MFFGGDPFSHAHHGGGRARSRPAADVDTTKLYETLGVRLRFRLHLCSPCFGLKKKMLLGERMEVLTSSQTRQSIRFDHKTHRGWFLTFILLKLLCPLIG